MIQATSKTTRKTYDLKIETQPDITTTKIEYEQEIQEDGTIITKPKEVKTNVTKMVNATAKLIKQDNAESKIKEIENIMRR